MDQATKVAAFLEKQWIAVVFFFVGFGLGLIFG